MGTAAPQKALSGWKGYNMKTQSHHISPGPGAPGPGTWPRSQAPGPGPVHGPRARASPVPVA